MTARTPARARSRRIGPAIDPARRAFCAAAPVALVGAGLLAGCASRPPRPPHVYDAVPSFARPGRNGLPRGWEPYIQRPDRARTRYVVEPRDGREVLHATAERASSGLGCKVDIDPYRTPWLRWDWRVDALHEAATVADDAIEDSPARVVVAFDGDMSRLSMRDYLFYEQVLWFTGHPLPFATLTYLWDGQLPVGSALPYVRSPRIQYLVVESGVARTGRWLRYERNVLDDYRRVFGEPASGHITDVGVLTDSDDLKNRVEAWYGDIGLHAEPGAVG